MSERQGRSASALLREMLTRELLGGRKPRKGGLAEIEGIVADRKLARIAYTNRKDPGHKRVREAIRRFGRRLITSNFVFAETVTILRYSTRNEVAVAVGEKLLDPANVTLVRLSAEDEMAAWELMKAREDRKYSSVDCSSFVLMRRLALTKAVTLDGDFRIEGLDVLP